MHRNRSRLLCTALLALFTNTAFAAPPAPPILPPGLSLPAPPAPPTVGSAGTSAPFSAVLSYSRGISLAEFCTQMLEHTLKKPFVLAPEVLAATEQIGLGNIDLPPAEAEKLLKTVLSSRGFTLEPGPVYYVSKTIPPEKVVEKREEKHQIRVTYKPTRRSISYYASALPQVFPDAKFSFERSAAKDAQLPDFFVAYVDEKEKPQLDELVKQLDEPVAQVAVRAMLVEVSDESQAGHGVQLAASALADKLAIKVGAPPAGDSIVFTAGSVTAAFGVFDGDARFRTLTSPALVIAHGTTGTIDGVTKVPIVSSTTQDGATSQNTTFVDVGTSLSVQPQVAGESITLKVALELSEAQATSGVAGAAPSILSRSASSDVILLDRQVVVLGGIISERGTGTSSSLFGFELSQDSSRASRELLLVLYAEIVK